MQHIWLGHNELLVPVLTLGTASFSSVNAWSDKDGTKARRLVDICLDAGLNMFDTADVYSNGDAEVALGRAIAGRRSQVIISSKAGLRSGSGPDDVGASRRHLIDAVNGTLRRLGTDYIDLFQLHTFDALTPLEETLLTLDDLVRAGKIRYLGVSNFSGWQLMKSLAVAQKNDWKRYIAHQVYYSLIGRDYERELMPLGIDQGVSALVWSPLGWGRLRPKTYRSSGSRSHDATPPYVPPVDEGVLGRVIAELSRIASETGRSEVQIALNWLLQRPTVASLIIGVSSESQLIHNIEVIGWSLSGEHIRRLDTASATGSPYPYWHQEAFPERNPSPKFYPKT